MMAVVKLASGWNPFHDPPLPYTFSGVNHVNTYSKGAWIVAASLYQLLGQIEPSKAFNFILLAASLFLSFAAFARIAPPTKLGRALLLSCLFSLNPVTVTQLLTFCVDGQLASLMVCALSLLLWIFQKEDRYALIALAIGFVVILNNKFNGMVYAIIFGLGFVAFLFLYRKRELGVRFIIIGSLSFLLGILLVGFNPYVTNTVRYGQPFYGVVGNSQMMEGQLPANLVTMNRFEKAFYSIFSKSEEIVAPSVTTPKMPFLVVPDELLTFRYSEVRIGAWRPLFGGALILSVVVVAIALAFKLRWTLPTIGVISVIVASIFIIPEPWWARFVPQFSFIPIAALALVFFQKELHPFVKYAGYVLAFIMTMNIYLVTSSHVQGAGRIYTGGQSTTNSTFYCDAAGHCDVSIQIKLCTLRRSGN